MGKKFKIGGRVQLEFGSGPGRPIGEFIDLLADSKVCLVVDVRAVPRSRTNPQYNRETLPDSLLESQIAYEHIAGLGGRRSRARETSPDVNGFWKNQSFHNYADYAMGDAFHLGLVRLRELGHVRCCAVMCAEAVWWRCLIATGERVFHILGPNVVAQASLTKIATANPDGMLTYPRN